MIAPITTGRTLREAIIARMALLVLGSISLLSLSYVLFGLKPTIDQIAEAQFSVAVSEVTANLDRVFEPVRTLLPMALGWLEHQPPSVDDPDSFNRLFKPMLEHSPHLTSVVAGTTTGKGWLLLQLSGGVWRNRLTDVPRWGQLQHFFEWKSGENISTHSESIDYDPRQRAWFKAALDGAEAQVQWTKPYTFFTTGDPGITASIRTPSGEGEQFILGFDLMLRDLSSATINARLSPNGIAMILTEDLRVLALPRPPSGTLAETWSARILQQSSELGIAAIDAALERWRSVAASAGQTLHFSSDDQDWLVAVRPYHLGNLSFNVMVLAPASDLYPAWRSMAWLVAGTMVTVLLLAIMLARNQARRIARPLEQLLAASERLGKLDFSGSAPIKSGISEVDRLAHEQEAARILLSENQHRLLAHEHNLHQQIEALQQAEARLSYAGHHDALTDLPNRLLLTDRLKQAISRAARLEKRVALLFIDLDNFKTINDTLGHDVGDQLLCTAATRLASLIRASDTVGRLGGDEFVVLLDGLDNNHFAGQCAANILNALARPFEMDERALYVTASIGISMYPDDGVEVATLLRNADAAMYKAKGCGRNTYRFYTESMTREAVERLALQGMLRSAVERNEFVLHFQPQVSLYDGRLTGIEALIRWQHPQRGLVAPSEFIPLAEESGTIFAIGQWVLEESCRTWHDLAAKGIHIPGIAVNLSVVQLRQQDFVTRLRQTLTEYGVPREAIEIELTESVFLETEDALDLLKELGKSGSRLSLDDFGTGYSSLSYLKRLPFQKLKIDKSFVGGIGTGKEADALVRSVIGLGHALELTLVAEGVETPRQARFLRQHYCDEGQGYLFAKPLPIAELVAWVSARTRKSPDSACSDTKDAHPEQDAANQ
ncbi:MAG: EAL domain-containing protein [Zoogloeaceae bacterium]|nr:EAL domain-containing protein [Zoogloeaceae bacterium]